MRYVEFKLDKGAKKPFKKYHGDAGWDLFISEDCTINPGETQDVHTGVYIDMPPYLYARITGRSSSLRVHHVLVNEGIIDNGYTGELFICVHNLSNKPFKAEKGMRLAQILFHTIEDIRWSEVNEFKPVASTNRGEKGFGSTGR